jgi:hypothetical protein
MCGIFGYVLDAKRAPPLAQRAALVSALAVANTRRGGHSWGAYSHAGAAAENGEVLKGTGPMAAVPGLDTLAVGTTVMAHCRYATNGAVTSENSHPFTIGNILGAHNGMVYNHEALSVKYQRKIEVDSEHLFHHVTEGRPFTDVVGYGTVEYVRLDGDLREVHLCKMAHGQLAVYGLGPRKKPYGVVWSSDEQHLRAALRGAGLKGFPYNLRESRVYTASADGVLYKTEIEHKLSVESVSREEQRRAEAITRGEVRTVGLPRPVLKGGPRLVRAWDPVPDGPTNLFRPAAEIPGLTRMPDGSYTTKGGAVVQMDLAEQEDLLGPPPSEEDEEETWSTRPDEIEEWRQIQQARAAGKVH